MKQKTFWVSRVENYQRQKQASEKLVLRFFKTWGSGFATLCALALLFLVWVYIGCRSIGYPPPTVLHWKRDLVGSLAWVLIMNFVMRERLKSALDEQSK